MKKKVKSTLFLGDCLEVIKDFDDNSIDTIITDPPYNLHFMGKDWDKSGVSLQAETWKSLLRVAKPGGLSFMFWWHSHLSQNCLCNRRWRMADQGFSNVVICVRFPESTRH